MSRIQSVQYEYRRIKALYPKKSIDLNRMFYLIMLVIAKKPYQNLLFSFVNIRILCLFLPDWQGQSSVDSTARFIQRHL